MSFESIVSHKDFAIASHYEGNFTTKVRRGNLFVLVYATPEQVRVFQQSVGKLAPFLAHRCARRSNGDSARGGEATYLSRLRSVFPQVRAQRSNSRVDEQVFSTT